MAAITFQTNIGADAKAPDATYTLSGSGLGFFGTTAGSSVQIGAYQSSTYISNADGSVTSGQANNTKYVAKLMASKTNPNTVGKTWTIFESNSTESKWNSIPELQNREI